MFSQSFYYLARLVGYRRFGLKIFTVKEKKNIGPHITFNFVEEISNLTRFFLLPYRVTAIPLDRYAMNPVGYGSFDRQSWNAVNHAGAFSPFTELVNI